MFSSIFHENAAVIRYGITSVLLGCRVVLSEVTLKEILGCCQLVTFAFEFSPRTTPARSPMVSAEALYNYFFGALENNL